MGIFTGIAMCVGLAMWASRKGFNPALWFLGGGLLGIIVLACMPSATKPGITGEQAHSRTVAGNIAGGVLSGLVAVVLVLLLAH